MRVDASLCRERGPRKTRTAPLSGAQSCAVLGVRLFEWDGRIAFDGDLDLRRKSGQRLRDRLHHSAIRPLGVHRLAMVDIDLDAVASDEDIDLKLMRCEAQFLV